MQFLLISSLCIWFWSGTGECKMQRAKDGDKLFSRARRSMMKKQNRELGPYDDSVQNYLARFGYLPGNHDNNNEAMSLRTEHAVQWALSRLQSFAGLRATGRLDAPTRRLMATKRCGMPDEPYEPEHRRRHLRHRIKRYVLHGSSWKHLNITYRVENYASSLDIHRTRRVIYDAFKVWSRSSKLAFFETMDPQADIQIKFASKYHGDSYPFDGPNVVLAHAFFPASGLGGDVHFDNDEDWTDRPKEVENGVNLLSTAAHEIGHSLGLGHSRVQNSLMYPYYKYEVDEIKLGYDDMLAVQQLYGVGLDGKATPGLETTTHIEPRTDDVTTLPSSQTTSHYIPQPPDPCNSSVDAVARIRGQIFVFKDKYYWRLDHNLHLVEHPREIVRFWHGLPDRDAHVTKIDAIYERADKNRIIIFVGRDFYEFSANRLRHGPRCICDLGFEADVPKIDAAFVWDYNEKTYLFSGDRYWRFDEDARLVEHNYPRSIASAWEDVPANVDAAFTDKEGVTYFFKDNLLYKFNDYFMRVAKSYPQPLHEFWPSCDATRRPSEQRLLHKSQLAKHFAEDDLANCGFSRVKTLFVFIMLSVLFIVCDNVLLRIHL